MKQVKEFLEKLQNDEALATKAQRLRENKGSLSEIITLASEYGFVFTVDDWRDYINANFGIGKEELGEEELEAVSGGGVEFMGCRFNGVKNPILKDIINGSDVYTRRCFYHKNFAHCTYLTCGCYGTHCCTGGHHRTNSLGDSIHYN